MNIVIPDSLAKQINMSPADLILEFAILLFHKNKLTKKQAAYLANISEEDFENKITVQNSEDPNSNNSRYPQGNSEALQLLKDVAITYSKINEPEINLEEIYQNRTKTNDRKIGFG